MRADLVNTRALSLQPNTSTVSMRAVFGQGPKGEDGSNVLPTDEAIANAIDTPGSDTELALSASIAANVPTASTTVAGKVELTTPTEAVDGLDGTRAVTPVGLAAANIVIPNVVFEGDSLSSSGVNSTTLAVNTYNDTMPAFAVAGVDPRAVLFNNSSFGKQLTTMVSGAAANIDTRYSTGKQNVVVLWGGTNDLGLGAASSSDVLTRISTFVAARRAVGWKVVTVTMLPRSDGAKPVGFDANRATINTALNANAGGIYGDVIANPAGDTLIGDDGDSASTIYYSDALHMTVAGYFRVALTVRAALASLGVKLGERSQNNPQAPVFSGTRTSLGIGFKALFTNTADNNTALGSSALSAAVTGAANTGIGSNALAGVLGGTNNTGVGFDAGLSVTTGTSNTAVGSLALISLTTGSSNTAIGYQAAKVTTGGSNTAVGMNALLANTTGASNVAVGDQAMATGAASTNSVALGSSALGAGAGATNNVAVGSLALRTSTGAENVGVGFSAGYQAGGNAANATTTGTRQVNIGSGSGQNSATQRNDTVALGYRALVDANDAVALGSGAQALHASSVALGKAAVTTAASQVQVGTRHLEYAEVTAPGVATTNGARVYAKDNGSGKTQLCVIFQTGTEFVLATEA